MALKFGSKEEALAWADAWVTRNTPSPTFEDLQNFEATHQLMFRTEYGRLQAQMEVAIDQLVGLMDQVNYVDKSGWPRHRALQYMMLSHNLKPFVSALDRLKKGYYEDSVTLSRGLYETFLRAVFVSCHADDPWGVFPNAAAKGTTRFKATDFPLVHLRLAWQPIYRTMSAVAHSNFPQVMKSVMGANAKIGDPEVFGLSFEDDRKMLEFAGSFLPFLVVGYLRFAIDRFIGDATVKDAEQLEVAREAADWGMFILSENDKDFWRGVAADLGFLFEVVALADAGGDWRVLAAKRPKVKTE